MPSPLVLAFVTGTWTFLAFLVIFFFAVSHGYCSRSGSAINQRPYHDPSGDAPGAHPEHHRPRHRSSRLLARHPLTGRAAR